MIKHHVLYNLSTLDTVEITVCRQSLFFKEYCVFNSMCYHNYVHSSIGRQYIDLESSKYKVLQ